MNPKPTKLSLHTNNDADKIESDNAETDATPELDPEAESAEIVELAPGKEPETEPVPAVSTPIIEAPASQPKPAITTDPVMTEAAPATTPPKRRRWLRRLARLFVLALVVCGLGAGAYFAWPTINERYIQPVETTAADLTTVQDRLDNIDGQLETTDADVTTKLADIDTRIATIEAGQADATTRLDSIDELLTTQTARIDDLDDLAATLGDDLATTNSAADRQLNTTRATELMSRARLFLYQANYGLAIEDLTAARNTLSTLDDPPDASVSFAEVVDRLDRAIANLPDFPVAAVGDLDIAWRLLLGPDADPADVTPADPNPTAVDETTATTVPAAGDN